MGYWITAFGTAFSQSFEQIGCVDLVITVFGGAVVIILKASPWFKKWNFEPKHPVLSETWRLLVTFIILFLITSLVIVPNRMFEEEHAKALQLQAKLDDANAKLTTADTAVNKSEERATRLSDALAMGKSVADSDDWPALPPEAIDIWVESLKGSQIKTLSVRWASEVDSRNLYKSIEKIGKKVGFKVTGSMGQDANAFNIYYYGDTSNADKLRGLFSTLGASQSLPTAGYASGDLAVTIPSRGNLTPTLSTPSKSTSQP